MENHPRGVSIAAWLILSRSFQEAFFYEAGFEHRSVPVVGAARGEDGVVLPAPRDPGRRETAGRDRGLLF